MFGHCTPFPGVRGIRGVILLSISGRSARRAKNVFGLDAMRYAELSLTATIERHSPGGSKEMSFNRCGLGIP